MSNKFKVGIDPIDIMWDDHRFPTEALRLSGVTPPTATTYKGGTVLAFADNRDEKVTFNCQLPHGWKMSDLDAHCHIVLPTAGGGGGVENVKFDLTYSWAYIGYDFPAETTITATRDVQNDGADTHILMDIGDILESNAAGTATEGVSSMLICSFERDTSVTNDYTDDIYLIEIDFHIQFDALGSRLEASK